MSEVKKAEPSRGNLEVNYDLCTGCRLCEIACSLKKEGRVIPEASRIKVYQFPPGYIDIPAVCHRCPTYPCRAACPPKVTAISVDEKTAAVIADSNKCVGIKCSLCRKACPHELAVSFHPVTKKALICDLCQGEPECAKVCPTGALTYVPGSGFSGLHYASTPPKAVAEAISMKFYTAKGVAK